MKVSVHNLLHCDLVQDVLIEVGGLTVVVTGAMLVDISGIDDPTLRFSVTIAGVQLVGDWRGFHDAPCYRREVGGVGVTVWPLAGALVFAVYPDSAWREARDAVHRVLQINEGGVS